MRRREPCGVKCWMRALHLFVTPELPRAIIDVVELIEDANFKATSLGNRRTRRDASSHRTRIDLTRMPGRCDALGGGGRLRASALGQGKVFAPAKPLRLDSFDMPVTREENLGHARALGYLAPTAEIALRSQLHVEMEPTAIARVAGLG